MDGDKIMDCLTECPECRNLICLTKDGWLKKKNNEKNMIHQITIEKMTELNLIEDIDILLNYNNKMLSQVQYDNSCSLISNHNILNIVQINERLLMEARSIDKVLQLLETKIVIIEPKASSIKRKKEIPLLRIKSIQFHESTLLYIGSIKFTIEKKGLRGESQTEINTISWPTRTFNHQFKLISEAILQQQSLLRDEM